MSFFPIVTMVEECLGWLNTADLDTIADPLRYDALQFLRSRLGRRCYLVRVPDRAIEPTLTLTTTARRAEVGINGAFDIREDVIDFHVQTQLADGHREVLALQNALFYTLVGYVGTIGTIEVLNIAPETEQINADAPRDGSTTWDHASIASYVFQYRDPARQ